MAVAHSPVVVLDCPDPAALAAFYGALLGWPTTTDDETWAHVTADDGRGQICFQQVADFQPPQWPGQAVPRQMHLDLSVDDLDAAERQTLALGATKAAVQPGTTFRVFYDPAGHPFCLCVD